MGPMLNERSRRRFAATEAQMFGRGGIAAVVRATGISYSTVQRGVWELTRGVDIPGDRIRRFGAGRKRATALDRTLAADLQSLVEPATRGDPQSRLRWTSLGTRKLARELRRKKHKVSHTVVAEILHEMGYSLQAPRKSAEGKQHPDRNAQFEYVNASVAAQQKRGEPAVSVDCNNVQSVVMCSEPGHGGVVHT